MMTNLIALSNSVEISSTKNGDLKILVSASFEVAIERAS